VAVLGASAWAFVFTYGMLFAINKITPVRVSEAEEAVGLDTALHSEQAYDLDAKSA
jgi:Amt family ammonium transporter